jgi:GGDEF domain-containing protein
VVDVASIFGMPEGTIPLPVQTAVTGLMEEIERLRDELSLVHQRELWLEGESDRHPVLAVLQRRAFLREMGRLLDHSQRVGNFPGTLVYLHVGGVETFRAVHGLAASDAILIRITAMIRAHLRQTDLIGYLDAGDYAIGLAGAEGDGAEAKIGQIVHDLTVEPWTWEGKRFLPTLTVGLVKFRPDASASNLLADADAIRRGLSAPTE